MIRGIILVVGGIILELLIGDKALQNSKEIIELKYYCFIGACVLLLFIPNLLIRVIVSILIALTFIIAVITSSLKD